MTNAVTHDQSIIITM